MVAHREKGHLLSALLRMGGHQGFSLCAMGIYGNKHSQKMGTEQGGWKWQWNRKLPQWQSGKTTKMMKWRKVNQGGAGAAVVSEGAAAGVLQREVIKRVCVL